MNTGAEQMELPPVLITRRLPAPVMKAAGGRFRVLLEDPPEGVLPRETLLEQIVGAEGLVSLLTEQIDRTVIDAAPGLRIIGNVAVGYDNIDVEYARSKGIGVTHTPGVLTETTAELTVGLILAVTRRIVEADRFTREGRFTAWGPTMLLGMDLTGKQIGCVGFGRIGRAVASRLSGFGVRLVYADPHGAGPEVEQSLGVSRLPLEELIRTSDVISIHVPLTSGTRHLFSHGTFRSMREGAVLVNTSRGPVVDEGALVEALQGGILAGAGLDVYEDEPRIHPALLEMDNVVLLPHIGSATTETRVRMGMMAVDDVSAVLGGGKPRFPVP